jgi:uncharacterized protein
LYWPAQGMLVFSDLHLEKASFLARFHAPLPCYDSLDTVQRMQQLIVGYRPERVLCLGDSLHDPGAILRLGSDIVDVLENLVRQVPHWHWVKGNHDGGLEKICGVASIDKLELGHILFTHEPTEKNTYQVIGHFHPKIQVRAGGQKIKGKCFIRSGPTLIMPAFGSFTGGLFYPNLAYEFINKQDRSFYLLHREKIFYVGRATNNKRPLEFSR